MKLAVLAVLAAVAVVAAPAPAFADYESASGATFFGLRPTSLGLPQIGATATIGAGELPTALRSYHDSGDYDRDAAATAEAARAYLEARLAPDVPPAKLAAPRCRVDYHRIKRKKGKRALYRRVRHCRASAAAVTKPAIVLDIDETSLSNYSGLVATNFAGAGTAGPAASGTGTALAPTLALYRAARTRGVAVFFITGRPQEIAQATADNLKRVGYDQGWDGLQCKPADQGTAAYKTGARAAIERAGYTIVLNLGDQESDLDGGHAERSFKLPNPFYFIPD